MNNNANFSWDIKKIFVELGNTKLDTSLTKLTQPSFSCSKLIIETLKQGVKYVQS